VRGGSATKFDGEAWSPARIEYVAAVLHRLPCANVDSILKQPCDFQFAFTIGFQYMHPPASTGIAVIIGGAGIRVRIVLAYIRQVSTGTSAGKVKMDRLSY
jgi:hypothetical protein